MILHSTKLELPLPIGALGQSEKLKEKGVKKNRQKNPTTTNKQTPKTKTEKSVEKRV